MEIDKTGTTAGAIIEKEGGSALEIALHPLVLINISDHYTRAKYTSNERNPRVIGALLGVQSGRSVEVTNSFELVYSVVDGAVIIDVDYLKRKQEQFVTIFKNHDLLGWYSTGDECKPADIQIHNQFIPFNESPLYLLLDTLVSKVTSGLPVQLFESELRIINDEPTLLFSKVQYRIETGEAERIAVDHVARVSASGTADGSQLTAHLAGMHSAIKMLHSKIKNLTAYLHAVEKGEVPADQGLLRQVATLCNLLPAIDTAAFKADFVGEYNDTLLVTYLASITKGTALTNDLVDRFNIAYDRHSRRGRGFGWA